MNYLDKVKKNGIMIIDFYGKDELKMIISEVEEVGLNWFIIKCKGKDVVVVKSSAILDDNDYLKELYVEGDEAFLKREYIKCLEIYKDILLYDVSPKVFLRIGICYFNINKMDDAVDYLNVANGLDKTLDLELLINKAEMKKRKYEMKKEDETFSLYSIANYNEIIDLYKDNVSFEEIFNKFNLNGDQRSLVYMAFAKEYYCLGMEKLGDKYLHLAKKQVNKSKFSNLLIEEISSMKKFYEHKEESLLLIKKI